MTRTDESTKKEQTITAVMEQLWLNYYNDALFCQGVITEKEHDKMRVRILNRKSGAERNIR